MKSFHPITKVACALALLALGGCTGNVGDTTRPASGTGGSGGSISTSGSGGASSTSGSGGTSSGAGGDTSSVGAGGTGTAAWPVKFTGQPSALRRLSRDELVASLTMLVGAAPARDDLPADQRTSHGAIMLAGTSFIATELSKLKVVLSAFAAQQAPTLLSQSGCSQKAQAQRDCLAAWATKLAAKAFRRPLQDAEKTAFNQILTMAGSNSADDTAAVEGALTAIVFAPSFLYRTELGTAATSGTERSLTAAETATRLSFMTTLAPPDATLQAAADAGTLSDSAERVKQFQRLAATDRGKKAVSVFVLEWLGANERMVSTKSERYLTGLDTDYEAAIRASAETAILGVVGGSANQTVSGLLTTSSYLNDTPVKAITQAAGSGTTASGDSAATNRIGLMMHPHVIAAHTKEDGSSPFVLGPFMRQAFMCEPIPDPPPGAANMARTDVPAGSTTRESLEYRTGAPNCQSCHSSFAQLGYAFLPFDPVGRWVTKDPTGKDWDLTGTIKLASGPQLSFDSPSALMKAFAGQPQVYGCFGQSAIKWALGRELIAEDGDLVKEINEVAAKSNGNVMAILQAVVASSRFVTTTPAR
jgi:hypothetical protein